jgi:hypothetical protein
LIVFIQNTHGILLRTGHALSGCRSCVKFPRRETVSV